MMIHDDPWFALWFIFHALIHEIAQHPGKFVPALIVFAMLCYIGFEAVRACLRQRRRSTDVHQEPPPGLSS